MIVYERGKDGRPREYEFNDVEAAVREIHDNLLDAGMSQGAALRLMLGGGVPDGLRDSPILDAMDPEFLALLAD